MSRNWELSGRTAFVSGAARGIGAATVRDLHRRGMNVALAGLEPERLTALASELGPRALAAPCDVTSPAELSAAVDRTIEQFGAIDAVVANAGVNVVGTVEACDRETWEKVIMVNLLGVTRTVHATLPHVISSKGYIIPVASVAAMMPLALGANYTAAKHGVHGFAQALRLEVQAHGVDVGCAYFGAIDTDMIRGSAEDPAIKTMMTGMAALAAHAIPPERAGAAIARAVAGRRRRAYAPKRILPILLAPNLFAPLLERTGREQTDQAVRIANERARAGEPVVTTFVEERSRDEVA